MVPNFIFYIQVFSTFVPYNLRFLFKFIRYFKSTYIYKAILPFPFSIKWNIARYITLPYLKHLHIKILSSYLNIWLISYTWLQQFKMLKYRKSPHLIFTPTF